MIVARNMVVVLKDTRGGGIVKKKPVEFADRFHLKY